MWELPIIRGTYFGVLRKRIRLIAVQYVRVLGLISATSAAPGGLPWTGSKHKESTLKLKP